MALVVPLTHVSVTPPQETEIVTNEQAVDNEVSPEEQQPQGQVLEELQALGQQLAKAVKSLWESEESRKLRQEIGDGVARLGQQIDSALHSAQDSEAAKKIGTQVKGTVDKARGSDTVSKLEQSLITGLQELNRQVSKLVDSMESRSAHEEEPAYLGEAEDADQTEEEGTPAP